MEIILLTITTTVLSFIMWYLLQFLFTPTEDICRGIIISHRPEYVLYINSCGNEDYEVICKKCGKKLSSKDVEVMDRLITYSTTIYPDRLSEREKERRRNE